MIIFRQKEDTQNFRDCDSNRDPIVSQSSNYIQDFIRFVEGQQSLNDSFLVLSKLEEFITTHYIISKMQENV